MPKKSLICYNRKPLQYLAVSANPQEEELVVVDDMENLLEKKNVKTIGCKVLENIGRIKEATTDLSFDSPQSLLGAVHHCSHWITNIINTSNLLNVRISNRISPHIPLNFIHTAPNSLSFTQPLIGAGRHCSHRITGMIIIAFHAVFIN